MLSPITIVHLEDDALVASAISSVISTDPSLKLLASVETRIELLDLLRQFTPDILIVDLDVPGTDPEPICQWMSRVFPQTRVIVFSATATGDRVDECLDQGAWGFVWKGDGHRALVDAVHRVHQGEVLLSEEALLASAQPHLHWSSGKMYSPA